MTLFIKWDSFDQVLFAHTNESQLVCAQGII